MAWPLTTAQAKGFRYSNPTNDYALAFGDTFALENSYGRELKSYVVLTSGRPYQR